jgi:hypothetical protein
MARFYANENFPMPVVEELRRLGHDTLTSDESGRSNQSIPDEEVLSFALMKKGHCSLLIESILFNFTKKGLITQASSYAPSMPTSLHWHGASTRQLGRNPAYQADSSALIDLCFRPEPIS